MLNNRIFSMKVVATRGHWSTFIYKCSGIQRANKANRLNSFCRHVYYINLFNNHFKACKF